MDERKVIDVEEVREVPEGSEAETAQKVDEAEELKKKEAEMIDKFGCVVYYDGKLADLDKVQVVNKVYSLINVEKNTLVLYRESIMKVQGLIAALSVKNIIEAMTKQRFEIVETDSIGNLDGILFK